VEEAAAKLYARRKPNGMSTNKFVLCIADQQSVCIVYSHIFKAAAAVLCRMKEYAI